MTITASNLGTHVWKLAAEIGERNVFRFPALADAAHYIQQEWTEQGYDVLPQPYEVQSAPCLNLEITRWGRSRRQQIILVGAHYDSVRGSPGADGHGYKARDGRDPWAYLTVHRGDRPSATQ